MQRKRILFRVLKITGIAIGSVIILLLLLPLLFPKTISNSVKGWINESITSTIDFSGAGFTFFKHFPSLTFTLKDVSITGSEPFENDILVAGKELSLGVDLLSLFSSSIKIDKIFLSDATINIQVDSMGNGNYNIYDSSGSEKDSTGTDDTGVNLENISLKNISLTYNDLSIPVLISARNLNYKGSGDLSSEVFDMDTKLSADSFTVIHDGQTYANNKQVKAKLLTAINTKSLSLVFQDNRVKINTLPVHFMGTLDFLGHGYQMDLKVESRKATLEDIIWAIPSDMTTWIENTKVKGKAAFNVQLKGVYDAAAHKMPDFNMNLNVGNGFINYKGSPQPIRDLALRMKVNLPSMNTDSLDILLDSLYFTVGKGFFRMQSHSVGLDRPYVDSKAKADLDLGAWSKALGLSEVTLGGNYKLDFTAKGQYAKGQNPKRIRKHEVITSIPSFSLTSELTNGYLKFASAPEPVQNVSFQINSSCPDNNFRNTRLTANQIHLEALKNVFAGNFKLTNFQNPHIVATLRSHINLGEVGKVLPLGNNSIDGSLAIEAKMDGNCDQENNLFPVTDMSLTVRDGKICTEYYPAPIENIQILADLSNSDGKLSGTSFHIQPISFDFEGNPFMLKADLNDLENITYDIVSKGTLNIGKLYQVFGIPGYELTGFIKTDLALKGSESNALAGRYQLLDNSGTMVLKDIKLESDLFPQPFMIHSGDFRFLQEKVWFDKFESSYGNAQFAINGYLNNVISYMLLPGRILKGKLSLTADKINLKEFTAFGDAENDYSRAGTDSSGAGVILIPKNLSVLLTADVREADYDGVVVNDFAGRLFIDEGKMKLQQTNFKLAGATFKMDADYEGISAHKGVFDFKVKADSFSVAKAYEEIPMFREMVTSASGVQGIVGLDYELSGRIDQNMMPVYPSLKGGGVIHLKNVKLKGFKLMDAVSRGTKHDDLKDPDLKGIDLKTTVKNNIISLDRVKLRILGFRPRFEGQVSLDGDLNIKGRVGLPPFGLLGIPFTVSGTSEDPVVKLRRDKHGNILQEKEDIDPDDMDPEDLEALKELETEKVENKEVQPPAEQNQN